MADGTAIAAGMADGTAIVVGVIAAGGTADGASYGWGGWWGPSAALLVSALGLGALPLRLLPLGLLAPDASER